MPQTILILAPCQNGTFLFETLAHSLFAHASKSLRCGRSTMSEDGSWPINSDAVLRFVHSFVDMCNFKTWFATMWLQIMSDFPQPNTANTLLGESIG